MSPTTTITNVRVFDGSQLTAPTTVVIDNGLIVAGPVTDALTTGEIVDGAGGTLLPGLIDTHAHVVSAAELTAAGSWGVTTVLDMGGKDLAILASLKEPQPGRPALLSAGYPASAPNSVFVREMGHPVSATVSGPPDARRFVAERVAEGSDYIKILVEDPKIPRTKALPPDSVAAIVAAAREAGLRTVAHIVSADTLRTALRAGVDVVTHTALTSDPGPDVGALLAERPVVIIPTLGMMDGVARSIGGMFIIKVLSLMMPAVRMKYAYAKSTVGTFHRAGMVILAGTDANDNPKAPCQLPHGSSLHDELERLVDAGLSPVEALLGATARAAAAFGLTDRGVIAPGLRADLVLVDGDPTRSIAVTRNLRGVWIGGTRVPVAT